MIHPQITIKDVAQAARVHYSTVSLALRGSTAIAKATRVRVRLIAERLGYTPNLVFSALSRYGPRKEIRPQRTLIAYLTNCPDEPTLKRHVYHRHIIAGARRQAKLLGYAVKVLLVGENQHDSTTLATYLNRNNVKCLIMAAFEPGFSTVNLNWEDYYVVKIDSQHITPLANSISLDQLEIVRLAHQKIAALGYRRVGLAVGRAEEEGTGHRYTMGCFIEQAALPEADRVPPLLFPHNSTAEVMGRLLAAWVRKQRVDAVLSPWPAARQHLVASGLKVPDSVAVVQLSLTKPDRDLAGVQLAPGLLGAKVVSQMATLLYTGQRGVPAFASHTHIPGTWQDGASAPSKI